MRDAEERRPHLPQVLQIIEDQHHGNHKHIARMSKSWLVDPIAKARIQGEETRVTIDKIEVEVLFTGDLIHGADELSEQMTASEARVQNETGAHTDMVRKRGAKAAHRKVVFAFQRAISSHIRAAARHHPAILTHIEVVRRLVEVVMEELGSHIRLGMPSLPVHLLDIDAIPKPVDLFAFGLGGGELNLGRV